MRLFHIMFPLVRRSSYDFVVSELAKTQLMFDVERSEAAFYKSTSQSKGRDIISMGKLISDLESKVFQLESEVRELETEIGERK